MDTTKWLGISNDFALITRHPGGFAVLYSISHLTWTRSYCNFLFSGARNRSYSMARCFVANFPRTCALQLTLPPILLMFVYIHTVFLAHCISSSFFTPALLSRITHCLLTSRLLFDSSHANVIFLSGQIDSIDASGQSRFFVCSFTCFTSTRFQCSTARQGVISNCSTYRIHTMQQSMPLIKCGKSSTCY